jgi:hypothetical protein
MTDSDGHHLYVGDEPGRVELAITDLRGVGDAVARLAGGVEHDTGSIKERWPGGHTGRVAAEDAARIGGALEVADILEGRVRFPTDPRKVHDAWMLLSPDQRRELLEGAPARFGNLNGTPGSYRDIANRATLTAQLTRWQLS